MSGCVCTKVLETPSHGRGLLRNRVPSHAVHGAPWIQAQAPYQPVCFQVFFVTAFSEVSSFAKHRYCSCRLLTSYYCLINIAPILKDLTQLCMDYCRLYGFKIHPLAYELQSQAAANFKTRPLHNASYTNNKRWWPPLQTVVPTHTLFAW